MSGKKLNTIMLIDDDSIFMWFAKTLLEKMDIVERIDCIYDAQTALDYLGRISASKESMEKDCPDIIFLDLDMPGVNGFKFMEELQQVKGCQDVPKRIVALTSSMDKEDMERALNLGLSTYLVKPLTETKVRKVIKNFQLQKG